MFHNIIYNRVKKKRNIIIISNNLRTCCGTRMIRLLKTTKLFLQYLRGYAMLLCQHEQALTNGLLSATTVNNYWIGGMLTNHQCAKLAKCWPDQPIKMPDPLLAKWQYYSEIMAQKRHGNSENMEHIYSGISHVSRKRRNRRQSRNQ